MNNPEPSDELRALIARLDAQERRQRRLMIEFRRASLTIVRAIEQECGIKAEKIEQLDVNHR